MPDKYIIQRRTASGLETVVEVPALESGKIDLSWLPVVGSMGAAIIERGSNANGDYIRWADGTQVCIAQKTVTVSISIGSTGVGWTDTQTWTYPAAFSSNVVFGSVGGWYKSGIGEGWVQTNAKGYSMDFRLVGTTSLSQNDIQVVLLAIGRWK